jgi:hypothetical protein
MEFPVFVHGSSRKGQIWLNTMPDKFFIIDVSCYNLSWQWYRYFYYKKEALFSVYLNFHFYQPGV